MTFFVQKLQSINFQDSALKWFRSFLSNRTIKINVKLSHTLQTIKIVPQG